MTIPIQVRDIGVDGVANTGDDQILNLLDRPAATPQTRLFTNPTDPTYDSDFHTVEFAVNRRFANKWMLLDVVCLHVAEPVPRGGDRTPARSTPSTTARIYNWRPNQRLFGDEGKETSTLWNYKVVGRYMLPVRDRRLGFVEGAERPPVGPQPELRVPRRRHPERARRGSDVEPRADGQHSRLPRRQELQLRPLRQGHRHARRVQRPEQRHGHQLLDGDRRRRSSASSAFSTRASSASACATSSRNRARLSSP